MSVAAAIAAIALATLAIPPLIVAWAMCSAELLIALHRWLFDEERV